MSGDSEVSDILTNDFQEKKEGYEPGTGSGPPGLTMEINSFISSECSVPSDAKIANTEEWAEEIGRDAEESIHDQLEGILPNSPTAHPCTCKRNVSVCSASRIATVPSSSAFKVLVRRLNRPGYYPTVIY
jgi:hypothetical protein